MVSSGVLNKILMLAALLIFGCRLALSYPQAGTEGDDGMQNDYVDYSDDDKSSPSEQTKPYIIPEPAIPQQNKSLTVTGILGEDVVLKCGLKAGLNQNILWYQGSKSIATGTSVTSPNFSLNATTYDLTILKSSPQSAGDYYCKLVPDQVFIHTLVVLGDHSMDVITPESSKSAQSSIHGISLMWPLSAILLAALQHHKI
ncbi:uncharacterized protein LOC117785708 [Drosophila innubila]|uniref:uncharacterized protein LOC117785708 n=1 Tax=Drosophila innubila TaxID=198719 RepID=UPI00148D8544|nr:uncharacterized protein LOC117785708 [Drosophila innubila]